MKLRRERTRETRRGQHGMATGSEKSFSGERTLDAVKESSRLDVEWRKGTLKYAERKCSSQSKFGGQTEDEEQNSPSASRSGVVTNMISSFFEARTTNIYERRTT